MNLSLKTDVASTNRKLVEYQLANKILVDKEVQRYSEEEKKKKAPKRLVENSRDRSGLIKGLKKIEQPKVMAKYDPFQGMPVATSYFTLSEDYDTGYSEYKKNEAVLAGGYDFQEALCESLLRAFSGLGVFVEEEKASTSRPTTSIKNNDSSNDVF
jgi:CDK-activating kinase assembly factor MAT1